MEGSAKETVIIVHGTWAAPEPGKGLWYQPVTGVAAALPLFTAKLDAALQERGSPARCWAHCNQGDQIFQWSGANSWIARTHAASALGDYVTKLQKAGWRCHIVAHSHGGNVVIEALPKIVAAARSHGLLGNIVTLGTPFIDTMSPISKRMKLRARIVRILSWMALVVLPMALAPQAVDDFLYISLGYSFGDPLDWPAFFAVWYSLLPWFYSYLLITTFILLFLIGIWFLSRHRNVRTEPRDLWEPNGSAPMKARLLAIGSVMDEPWQILHHLRSIDNPLGIKTNLLTHLFASMRSYISQGTEVSFIHGAKSLRDLGAIGKFGAVYLYLSLFCSPFFI